MKFDIYRRLQDRNLVSIASISPIVPARTITTTFLASFYLSHKSYKISQTCVSHSLSSSALPSVANVHTRHNQSTRTTSHHHHDHPGHPLHDLRHQCLAQEFHHNTQQSNNCRTASIWRTIHGKVHQGTFLPKQEDGGVRSAGGDMKPMCRGVGL